MWFLNCRVSLNFDRSIVQVEVVVLERDIAISCAYKVHNRVQCPGPSSWIRYLELGLTM
jgi:hypothetical protein